MRHPLKWAQRQTKLRPFLSALVVLVIVVTPGYFRIENSLRQNRETASQLVEVTKAQTDQAKRTTLFNCQTRNRAQQNGRDRFAQLFNALDLVFSTNPSSTPQQQQATHAFVESLRKAVPLDPAAEDVDCNADGQLTLADYG